MKKTFLVFMLTMLSATGCIAQTNNTANAQVTSEVSTVSQTEEQEKNMININLKIGNKSFYARLYDNEATGQLIKKFPVTYNMTELHGNEKYYYMSDPLPENRETPDTINKGEIMLYGNDCLVLFYDTFSNSYSYTRLGYIEDTTGLEEALGKGGVSIGFEVVK